MANTARTANCAAVQTVRPKIAALHFNVSILAGINSRVFMLAALENQPAHTHPHTHTIYTLCVDHPEAWAGSVAASMAPLEVQINNN